VASLVGLAFGFLIAIGLQGLLKAFGLDLPSTTTKFLPRTVIVSMAVGVLTTLFSSIAPAIRASRVAPVAAMRDTGPSTYTRSGRRTVSGAVVTVAGIGALLLGLFGATGNGASLVGLGAALVFLGVAILSPLIARPLARILGAPLPKVSGVPGKLGRENAMRNPKRTASTAAALMIGLGLVGFVSILAASLKASTAAALAQTLKADYIVTSTSFTGFSQDVAGRLRDDPTFNAVEEFRQGIMGYVGTGVQPSGSGEVALPALQVTGVDPASLTAVTQVPLSSGSLEALGDGGVLVYSKTAESNGWRVGDTITVRFASSGNKQLKVVGIYTDQRLLGQSLISLDTFDQNFTQHLDTFVLVTTAPGVSQAQAKAAVTRVAKGFPNVRLQDQAEFRKTQASQINQVLGLVTALLFLSVIIAVFGIMNTLGLSIYERTRELGLLRAVGMARRQVRVMVRWESVIIAVFGAILGIAVGFFFGWAMVRALRSQGLGVLSIPGGQLVIYILLAGWFGVVAAALPARRAAKLDVLRAIATE
jgi:putative ABC transport system permease protein